MPIIKKEKNSKAGPTDLTGGLVSIQGHYLYHLACAIMIFFVTKAEENLDCSRDGHFDLSKYTYTDVIT